MRSFCEFFDFISEIYDVTLGVACVSDGEMNYRAYCRWAR